ncbi:MAG: ABC transporter transmembrane domain-containing protein, partial [Candidatus Omnitrophota bacterium]|nr:ABC transporter transmembrane domain-containing protein [Candidatus Omnitrophota bacterium]
MKDYFKLLRFLKPHSGLLGLACICMFFSAIFDGISLSMIVPLADKVLSNKQIIVPGKIPPFLANFVSQINSIPPLNLIKIIALTLLAIFLLKGFFGFWQGYLMSDIGQRVIRDLRFLLYQKLQTLSLDYYSQKRSGELISRITNDVRVLENSISYGFTDLVYQSFQVVLFTFVI